MATISFNPQLCTRCGICTQICPVGLILPDGEDGMPFMPDAMDSVCIKCGACESFCPEGAISPMFSTTHSLVSASITQDMSSDKLGSYMRMRRSIRNYKDEPVDKKTIENILDIVRYAPSGINNQPVHWLMIHDHDEVRKITSLVIDWMRELSASDQEHPMKPVMLSMISAYDMGADPICRGAPHLAIAYAPDDEMSYTDCIIALSWFELAVPAYGLGACWAGFLKVAASSYQPLIDELGLPEGHVMQHAMMFGYPEYRIHNIPGRKPASIIWK
ncbi:nitroreductase family protein [Methanolobus mangrovi]|uniref:Nitroreductase family protein n=1 Tax=Methanolobus mangrovi TaxID=3072977 RepID=A0AA51UHJ7_9EURY|nr:nitroreductase family protein [Methanolobus mangrovi]WMW22267.1 nitroreductase family protein [Methanolobus mangrovi]